MVAGRKRLLREGPPVRIEIELPPADVAPCAGLPADPPVDADRDEPESLVEADAASFGSATPAQATRNRCAAQALEKLHVQLPPQARAAVVLADVDGDVDRPAVGRPRAVPAGVGEADDARRRARRPPRDGSRRSRRSAPPSPPRSAARPRTRSARPRPSGRISPRRRRRLLLRVGAADRHPAQDILRAHGRRAAQGPAAVDRDRLLRRRPARASAKRPAGATEHGDEVVAAVLCGPDGAPVEVSETLLSTEYGPDGVQRRATLELWVDGEEGQPLRGAGT